MASIQLIPKLKRTFSDEKERKQAIAWIMMAALCTSAVWIEFRSEPEIEPFNASSSSYLLPQGGRATEYPAEAVNALKVKSPLTFNQFMGLLKKETPKAVAAKASAGFMKDPVLADAVKEFTEPPQGGERQASEFMARIANLPEFHGFMQGMGGSSSAQAAFQRLVAMPQVDEVLRSGSARSAASGARGAAGARSSRAAFGDLASGKAAGVNLANKDQSAAAGVGKLPSVPPVGAWKEVGAIAGPAGSPLMAASNGGAIEGGGALLGGESGARIQPISSPSQDVKTIKLNPPPTTAGEQKKDDKKDEKAKEDNTWKNIVGGIFGAAVGFAIGFVASGGNPFVGAAGAVAGGIVGSKEGPIVIDAVIGWGTVAIEWLKTPF